MAGRLLRLALVLLWLGLTGWYVVRQVLPDLGLAPEGDANALLAGRMNTVQHYRLLWRPEPTHAATVIGTCSLGAETDDVGVRLEMRLDIRDTGFIPGGDMLRRAIGGKRGKGLRLNVVELLDASMRLRGLEASGEVFGVSFSAEGPVDHRGLALTWKAGGTGGEHLIPEVRPQRIAGGELAAGLPPGLQPGGSFTTRISTIDPAGLRLATKEAVFVVTGREEQRTAAGRAELNAVEMRIEGRRVAVLHCDARGVVHRQELLDAGLIIELEHITNQVGAELWPLPAPEAAR